MEVMPNALSPHSYPILSHKVMTDTEYKIQMHDTCILQKTSPPYPSFSSIVFSLSWVKMDNESVLSGHTGHSEPPTSRLSKSNLNNLNNKVTKSNTNLNDKVTKSNTNLNDKITKSNTN